MLAPTLSQAVVTGGTRQPPVVRELPADLETPVSIYLKLAGAGPSFLLESVTGGQHVARYSFLGAGLERAYVIDAGRVTRVGLDGQFDVPLGPGDDPLGALRAELGAVAPGLSPTPSPYGPAGLPPFTGGLVGYLSYETIRYFEPAAAPASGSGSSEATGEEVPEGIFLLADTLVAFDHAYGRMLLIANVHPAPGQDVAHARAVAEARLDALEARLALPVPDHSPARADNQDVELRSNLARDEYLAAVAQAKEHIAAGDIFQVVLSQRFSRETSAGPFDIYRSLRRLNPSPYMFFFDFAGLANDRAFCLIGASPEMHVRLQGRTATVRPIAGTRPRGSDLAADAGLERELLADPKERAEHVMLVDLARNDLGRVCEYGSVHVPEFMGIERYSHVMHIVSQVEGTLSPGYDGLDLLRATFPAGTVSGAPKIRAMQIIADLERGPRGPYAGAVGYLSYDGSLDTCITIRTLVMRGTRVSIQAGAGIVADSDPAAEYQETVNKARALAVAVERAEREITERTA